MGRYFAGAVSAMLLIGAGLFVWESIAQQDEPPPPVAPPPEIELPDPMTAAEPQGTGPPPPEATELTREQRRFGRYDRDRDGTITRTEMMSSRTNAFRQLDTNGDNYLTFEEWAVRTSERFASADADGSGALTPQEFATTRQRRSGASRSRCNC
ncbi:EF-hand domain-containing protein [Parasphingopyxis algicola]|uniref:EF-hand domain-containing protein n=1 Tax=Parasphingopyxis algicola TaxID=2026624 RepID=UPI0015A480BA|nr:EF-hand domain-containing protein [Parasphingopyxis algicola]QLC24202.1 EF-hand domain-containing protein [Parasphingopyxis algicola]